MPKFILSLVCLVVLLTGCAGNKVDNQPVENNVVDDKSYLIEDVVKNEDVVVQEPVVNVVPKENTAVKTTPPKNNMIKELKESTKEKFSLTTEKQEAIFRIGIGWVGGMGGYPIFTPGESRPVQVNNLPVYLADSEAKELLAGKMPSCVVGTPLVKIWADISLEEKEEENYSIEPDESGNSPTEKYYVAHVVKEYDVLVLAEECED